MEYIKNRHSFFFILFAFSATLLAVFWQEINLYYLQGQYPSANGMLTSADEASYLSPANNWYKTGEWVSSDKSLFGHFFRPPGQGLFFLFLNILFGSKVWIAMKTIQISLFMASIYAMKNSLQLLQVKKWFLIVAIYALTPLFSGFMYYTITEGTSPFLLLITFCFWLNYILLKKKRWPFILLSAFLLILRPQLLLFIIALLLIAYVKHKSKLLIIAFIPLVCWNIRTIAIVNYWPGFHPIYHQTNQSVFRPPHEALTEVFKQWEYKPENLHTVVALLSSDTSNVNLKKARMLIPPKYRNQMSSLLKDFQKVEYERNRYIQYKPLNELLKSEKLFIKKAKNVQSHFKVNFPFDFYIGTPAKSGLFFMKSFLNLSIFQDNWRGVFAVEILRYICVILVGFLFLSLFRLVFQFKSLLVVPAISILATFFYLIFFQRMNEERYILPFLPILLVFLAEVTNTKSDGKDNELGKSFSLLRK